MALVEFTDWDALRQLRLGGQKPSLPIIVTTKPYLPRRLYGVGCLVILHRAGEVMPIALLEGLDVIFWFDRCELVIHVDRLAKSKGIKFGWVKVWCSCAGVLSILPMSCASHAAMVEWLEGPAHAA